MFAQMSGGGKGRGRNVLATDPKQHVAEVRVNADFLLSICLFSFGNQVRISVYDNSRLFRMMIDGQKYGPFHHVRVSRAEIRGQPVVLPIQTFFPF